MPLCCFLFCELWVSLAVSSGVTSPESSVWFGVAHRGSNPPPPSPGSPPLTPKSPRNSAQPGICVGYFIEGLVTDSFPEPVLPASSAKALEDGPAFQLVRGGWLALPREQGTEGIDSKPQGQTAVAAGEVPHLSPAWVSGKCPSGKLRPKARGGGGSSPEVSGIKRAPAGPSGLTTPQLLPKPRDTQAHAAHSHPPRRHTGQDSPGPTPDPWNVSAGAQWAGPRQAGLPGGGSSASLLIGCLAGVYPIAVHIHGF